jgi:hypothetical protein
MHAIIDHDVMVLAGVVLGSPLHLIFRAIMDPPFRICSWGSWHEILNRKMSGTHGALVK